jgi:hypothetical protein
MRSRPEKGLAYTVFVSPYDVPHAVRGMYDDDDHIFIIEFRYIQDEPIRLMAWDENTTLRLGKHSGRLFGLQVDVDRVGAGTVKLDFVSEIDQLVNKLGGAPASQFRGRNFALASEVLQGKKVALAEAAGV